MATVFNASPVRLGATRAGEEDTRGLDFTAALPLGDAVASITAVSIARRDGVLITANDITITPAGAPAPWLIGNVVNWWHNSGAAIATLAAVDYQGTVSIVTVGGRPLIRDFFIQAVSGLG